jgi:hypothetical protein
MECRFAGETEVLGENLPQRHFCPSQIPTWPDPGLNAGRRGGKPATNRLRYGAAWSSTYDRPHLRPQKNKYFNIKPGCATEDTHNPGEEANKRLLICKSF